MKPEKRAASERETVRPPAMRQAPKVSGTYTTAPYTVQVNDLSFEEDELTPVWLACLVCKGRIFVVKERGHAYSSVRCKWCTNGTMSGEQINNYLNRDKIVETMLRRYVEE